MKIMYVTSECAPFIKTGGLGDVAGSLPQALAAKGHDVRVFCPLYSAIDQSMREKFYYIKNAYVRLGWRNQYCGIFRYEADGVTYYFIDNEYYFARGQIYGEYDDAERFAYYSKAVLEVLPDLEWKPDVINCNDWQTALVPVYYNLMFASRPFYENIKTVFTIHNIQYQGRYGREILEYVLGIDDAHFRSGFMAMDGDVNLMKAAIVASTAVTTVSPTYANEIQTEYYGYRLDSVLRMNSYKLHGILNGINMDAFNPETDSKIFKNYGPNNPQDKLVNKTELLKLCGLEGDANTPVIGIVTRFVDQKGLDLVEAVLPDILADDVRLIVLGTGDYRYEQMFIEAKRRWPDKVSASIMFSGDLANRIYAGADMFLMPSKFEPCGLAQMIALRYGTIPGGVLRAIDAMELVKGEPETVTFTLIQDDVTRPSRNVVLQIKGTEDTNENITFGAHFDSVEFSHGVYDNGAGSAILMELARHYKQNPPKRNLTFCWYGSEEVGLLGSKAYVAAHKDELKDVQLMINVDVAGPVLGADWAAIMADESLCRFVEYLAKEVGFSTDVTQEVYSSDSVPFANEGVPAINFCRFGRNGGAMIHCRHDVIDYLDYKNFGKTAAFVQEFADHMVNAVVFPVPRKMPENMVEAVDKYLRKKRVDEK